MSSQLLLFPNMNELNDTVPFARPLIGEEEKENILRVLDSGWLTTGAETLSFEKEFASFLMKGSDKQDLHALAVNSATSGLHLALEACGVGPGDIVLTSTYTFTSTAEVIRYLGADVVFVDTKPGSYLMDPSAFESSLERLTKGLPAYPPRSTADRASGSKGYGPCGKPVAVIPVHIAGLPCDMTELKRISKQYGLRVIEDAAHSFPSLMEDGNYAGTCSDAGVYSFYATKTITTGEGGMVVCHDTEIAERISIMRSHGIDRSIWNRYTDKKASWRYAVIAPGFKYNMSDVSAAIGRAQLKKADSLLHMRKAIAAKYDKAFSTDARLLVPPSADSDARHLYPLRLAGTNAAQYRDLFIERLQEEGIGVSVHFIPLHTMPYYAERYQLQETDFPNAMDSFLRSVSLPIWPGMSDKQTDRVIESVLRCIPKEL